MQSNTDVNILYIFITCQKNASHSIDAINSMMHNKNCNDYVIIVGGYDKNTYIKNKNLIQLTCNDSYEGLSDKICRTFHFLINFEDFAHYEYFCKLDEDMVFKSPIASNILSIAKKSEKHYLGLVNHKEGSRQWHYNKCSSNSPLNNKPYEGDFVPWCLGGYGYILSRHASSIIANQSVIDSAEIYEDLYIAKLLKRENILPINFTGLRSFIISPEHN